MTAGGISNFIVVEICDSDDDDKIVWKVDIKRQLSSKLAFGYI